MPLSCKFDLSGSRFSDQSESDPEFLLARCPAIGENPNMRLDTSIAPIPVKNLMTRLLHLTVLGMIALTWSNAAQASDTAVAPKVIWTFDAGG